MPSFYAFSARVHRLAAIFPLHDQEKAVNVTRRTSFFLIVGLIMCVDHAGNRAEVSKGRTSE